MNLLITLTAAAIGLTDNVSAKTPAEPNDLEIAHLAYTADNIDIRYARLAFAISENAAVRKVVWNLTVATRKTSWNTTAPLTTWSRMHLFPYVPALPSLQTGDVVPWLNEDIVPHTATGSDDSWDTGTIAASDSVSIVITKAMTGDYYCRFHPAMLASLHQNAR